MDMGCCVQEEWRGEVEEVSWSPRAFLLKGFLSDDECSHLINKVRVNLCNIEIRMLGKPGRLCRPEHLQAAYHLGFTHRMSGLWVQAKPSMVKSTVVDNDTGKSIDSTVRTSTGTFFGREVRLSLLLFWFHAVNLMNDLH